MKLSSDADVPSRPLLVRQFRSRSGADLKFSALGLGTAALGNLYRAQSDENATAAIQTALRGGVGYFDTAPLYGAGLAERRLGTALRGADRGSYILSTKAGRLLRAVPHGQSNVGANWVDVPSREVVFDYSYDGFMRSFEFSLERLGVDRVDILLCHDIDVMTHGSAEASAQRTREFLSPRGGYQALETLRRDGVVKAIGLGVNEWQVSQTIAEETDVDLFLLAGRFTLLEQEALKSFLPLCHKRNMGVIIGGPYNSGILASGAVSGARYNYDDAPRAIMARVRLLEFICASHGVRLKDAAIQFPLLHPATVSVIPGGASPAEVQDNIDAMNAVIPPALWSDLCNEGLIPTELIKGNLGSAA